MKNITRMQFALLFAFVFTIPCTLNASSVLVSTSAPASGYSDEWKNLKASEFAEISVNEFSRLIGKKMRLKEKISFVLLKKEMRHAAKMNPDLTVSQYLSAPHKTKKGWKIFIIVTSIVVSLLIAYLVVVAVAPYS